MCDIQTSGTSDYVELQTIFANLRNAQFKQLYESMSKRELEEELQGRGVTFGRKGPGYRPDQLRAKVMEGDVMFSTSMLMDSYGKMSCETDQAVQLFSVKRRTCTGCPSAHALHD